MIPKTLIASVLLAAALCAVGIPVRAAGPPVPVPLFPDPAQERLQAQIAAQQALAQARLAASQARVQAMLDANQARLEAQVAAQARAQLPGHTIAPASPLPPPVIWPALTSRAGVPGNMELDTLTPQLGRYFGTAHGVLVVRAPAHGALKLEDGDVILSIGGRTPASSSQAIRILASYDPGEKVRLLILRDHRKLHITATLPGSNGRH